MRHPVLYGEYELNIDDKSRLLVPSEIRRIIIPDVHGEAFFFVVGINDKPWLYPERYYEELVTRAPQEMTPELDLLAFDQLHFAMASRIEPDKQGRMLIPEKVLRRVGIKREVTLIGARDHLELWNREDWETQRELLDKRRAEISFAAKRLRQTPENVTPSRFDQGSREV